MGNNQEIIISYTIKPEFDNKRDEKPVVLDFEISQIENCNDFDELIYEQLDKEFSNCTCINEGNYFCHCGPVVEDFKILSRKIKTVI